MSKMMHRIVIDNNVIVNSDDSNISIVDNVITFQGNGDYTLEYLDSSDICLDIVIMDNVMVKLTVFSEDNEINSNIHYRLGERSNLLLFQFYCNRSVRENIEVDLDGEYSSFSSNFSSISSGEEEYHMIIRHNHSHVSSFISNKCIGKDGSKIKIEIDSILNKGNVDCAMDQNSRILTLGNVDATVIPNMFIEEDSVEARHGSVIGGFDYNSIFYLMSRGITEEEAMSLLIKGFIFSNLVVDMDKRGRIFKCIQEISEVKGIES